MFKIFWVVLLGILVFWSAGCSREPSPSPEKSAGGKQEGEKYLLATEPAGAQGVIEVREKLIRFFHEMRNGETGEILKKLIS